MGVGKRNRNRSAFNCGILDAQDWADLESLYAQAKKAETESRDNKECQQQLL